MYDMDGPYKSRGSYVKARNPVQAVGKRRSTEDRLLDAVCAMGEASKTAIAARVDMSESYVASTLRGLVAEGALAVRSVSTGNAAMRLYRLASAEPVHARPGRCPACLVRHKVGVPCFRRAA